MQMKPSEDRGDFVMRLFEAYYQRVFLFARKSAPEDVAEDTAQEVFIRILQHPRLEELVLSVSYLIKVAQNILRRRHARSMKLRSILTTVATDQAIDRHGHPDQPAQGTTRDEEDLRQLEAAMHDLTPSEEDAVRLIVIEGRSYEQAACSLDVSVSTINNWKHRGLAKLRKFVGKTPVVPDGSEPDMREVG
jgi:RNA polymerase sigma factor (sigma-70 family)